MSNTNAARRPRTLSIGGATYDIFLSLGSDVMTEKGILLRAGEKIPVRGVTETCGGGACNTSVGLARLGCAASYCGVLGADQWGTRLLETMHKEGVETSSSTIVEHETSSFSVIVSLPTGERTILAAAGTSEHLHDVTFHKDAIANADWIYLNHLSDRACVIENDIAEMLKLHPETRLTWNPGGSQIHAGMHDATKRSLLASTTFLLLNKEEAAYFTKTDTERKAIAALLAAGVTRVCITNGKHGVIAADATGVYRCNVMKNATIVDSTGAGDAFGIGATWALAEGKALPEALIAGTLNAASVLGCMGAQEGLLTADAITKKIMTHSLHVETVTD